VNNCYAPDKPEKHLIFRENPAGAITMVRGVVVLY
jgi:hypothetical protein